MSEVITREKIEDIFDQILIWNLSRANHGAIKEMLLKECQELDKLTVTRLRPMSEIPGKEYVLVKTKRSADLIECIADSANSRVEMKWGSEVAFDDCEGWIPMPKYEPEQS